MSGAFRRDPAKIRAWAEQHGIEVADAPEPAPGEPENAPGTEPEPGPASEPASEPEPGPAGQPHFEEYQRQDRARTGLDQRLAPPGTVRRVIEMDRDTATMARRLARLRAELRDVLEQVAGRKTEAGALAGQVARLTREADQLEQRARDTRATIARRAAEDERAAALARRVVHVLEGGRELDPFTSALAALAQNKRRLAETAAEDDPRLAALAGAVQESAERRAAVIQLQNRQITVNKNHGPDSAEAAALRRELAAARLAMAVLATLGTGLSPDDVISVALTGALPDRPGPPRLLTGPDWPVTG